MGNLLKGKKGTRGVPDGSGPEGKGDTGRQSPAQKPKREDFNSDEAFHRALARWRYSNSEEKSKGKGDMEKSVIALVVTPGQLSKANHPAKVTKPNTNTKSKIPYESHTERMKLAKMAADRMLGATAPESESKHADNQTVDHKGRTAGGKAPYSGYATGVSGEGSQADNLYGNQTYIVKPSELGASPSESSTKHTPVKNVRKKG